MQGTWSDGSRPTPSGGPPPIPSQTQPLSTGDQSHLLGVRQTPEHAGKHEAGEKTPGLGAVAASSVTCHRVQAKRRGGRDRAQAGAEVRPPDGGHRCPLRASSRGWGAERGGGQGAARHWALLFRDDPTNLRKGQDHTPQRPADLGASLHHAGLEPPSPGVQRSPHCSVPPAPSSSASYTKTPLW